MIGDVSGHGAAEAAVGVGLRVAWRALVLAGTSVPATIGLLEQMLVAEREGEQVAGSAWRSPPLPSLRWRRP